MVDEPDYVRVRELLQQTDLCIQVLFAALVGDLGPGNLLDGDRFVRRGVNGSVHL